jgi:predicted RNase H-like HicB family nuclease
VAGVDKIDRSFVRTATLAINKLPGLVTYGATIEEARTMAAEAIHGYLESLQKDNLTLPLETGAIVSAAGFGCASA